MKTIPVALAIVLSGLSVTAAIAQPPADGPTYMGVVEAVVGGQRLPLEKKTGSFEARAKLMGMGGTESYMRFEGAHSPVRLQSGRRPSFVMRSIGDETDPSSYIRLSVLQSRNGERRLRQLSAGIYGGMHDATDKYALDLNFMPSGRYLRFEPRAPLAPGEYAISLGDNTHPFLFGVD